MPCRYKLSGGALDEEAGEVLATTQEDDEPQDDNDESERDATAIHQQMVERYIHNDRAEEHKRERHIAIDQQEKTAENLKTSNNEHVMRDKDCIEELTRGSWRQSHREKV